MQGLPFLVVPLICSSLVSDDESEYQANRYCAKNCCKEPTANCIDGILPGAIAVYQTCIAIKCPGLVTLEENNNFFCNKAKDQDFSFITKCIYRELWSRYGVQKVMKSVASCLRQYGC